MGMFGLALTACQEFASCFQAEHACMPGAIGQVYREGNHPQGERHVTFDKRASSNMAGKSHGFVCVCIRGNEGVGVWMGGYFIDALQAS